MDNKQIEQLKAFGLSSHTRKEHYTFEYALSFMKNACERVLSYYDAYHTVKEDLYAQGMLDASIKAFEDYTEAFRDIATMYFIEKSMETPTTLMGVIRKFAKMCDYSREAQKMMDYLYERNKLVHEYYDREYHLEQFQKAMDNYSDGLLEIYRDLYERVVAADLLEKRIMKG